MRNVKVVTINVRCDDADRYAYNRESSLKLSEEHFTDEERAEITAIFLTKATLRGLSIDTTTTVKEIPADEEESFKVKYEAAQKTISSGYSERTKLTKERDELKAKLEQMERLAQNPPIILTGEGVESALTEMNKAAASDD